MTIFSINSGSFGDVTVTGVVSASTLKGDGSQITSVSYDNIASKPTLISSSTQVTALLPAGTFSSSAQVVVQNTTGIEALATTGSNTFTGAQTFSDTTNTTSYLDGAIHIAGGMSVRKDVRISGSMTINGLLTAVSMSTQYVTSSQYVVGTSRITLNDDDNVRFAGLSIIDSGSSSPTSASIFWDSLQHRFIYENLSGSNYNSSIIMAGPKHTGTLGDEVGLTDFRVPVAHGSDHIDSRLASSSIRVDFPSRLTHVEAGLYITGAVTASGGINAGSGLFGTLQTAAQTNVTSVGTLSSLTVSGNTNLATTSGNVGIGTTNTSYILEVYNSAESNVRIKTPSATGLAGLYIGNGNRDYSIITRNSVGNVLEFRNETANTTVFTVSGSNVGIGTTGPNAKLEVVGRTISTNIVVGAYATLNDTTGTSQTLQFGNYSAGAFIASSADAYIYKTSTVFSGLSAQTLIFQTRSDTDGGGFAWVAGSTPAVKMYINSSGNVGIGTTNPQQLLHIHSTSGAAGAALARFSVSGSNSLESGVEFYTTLPDDASPYRAGRIYTKFEASSYTGARLSFQSMTSGNVLVDTMHLRNGSVGIGTTNPTEKLHVYTDTGTYLLIRGANGNLASSLAFNHGGGGGRTGVNGQWNISFGSAETNFGLTPNLGGGLAFWHQDGGTVNDVMRLKTDNTVLFSGNVGIGTASPDLKLTVAGGFNLRNSSRAAALEVDSSGNMYLGTATTAGNINFETGHTTAGLPSTGTTRAIINQYGVGLGNNAPSSGTGIMFPASQNASSNVNTLDDYEEGSWTPTYSSATNCTSVTHDSAWYVKIGGLVSYGIKGTLSVTSANTKTNFVFTLPFEQSTLTDAQGGSALLEGPNPYPLASGNIADNSLSSSAAFVGWGASVITFTGSSSFYLSGTFKST